MNHKRSRNEDKSFVAQSTTNNFELGMRVAACLRQQNFRPGLSSRIHPARIE